MVAFFDRFIPVTSVGGTHRSHIKFGVSVSVRVRVRVGVRVSSTHCEEHNINGGHPPWAGS